ncbi:MAG: hypothetical protein EOL91_08635 [Actinobacteria bacterium]|nr:hypothetical protein [Actinomycetota bacterium]
MDLFRTITGTIRQSHATIWESLTEPRHVTMATMAGYGAGFVFAISIMASIPGQLPPGVYSARLASAILLGLAAVVGIPAAWRGWWLIEELVVWVWGFGIFMLGIAIWFDGLSGVQRAEGTFLVILALLAAKARWHRVRLAPYRLDAGPLLPEHRVEVDIARAMEADKKDRS